MKRLTILTIAIIVIGAAIAWLSQKHSQTDFSQGGQYLYIKDWGVRFKLPAEWQSKVIYATKDNVDVSLPAPDPNRPKTTGDVAYLTTNDFASLPNSSCKLSLANGQYGAKLYLFRSSQSNPPYNQTSVRLAGYNYVPVKSGGDCSPDSNQTDESNFVSQISNAVKGVERVRSSNN